MPANEGKTLDRKAQRAAAESHLKSIGMSRRGWLHPDLQVALHAARNENKIADQGLKMLGDLLKRTTVERMKVHLAQAKEIAKKSSGEDAFYHLMHAANAALSPPLEKKHLVIKHGDLHPQVKQKVQELLSARKKRIDEMFPERSDLLGEGVFISGAVTWALSDSIAKGVALGALVTAVPLTVGYKSGSSAVRESTKRVVEKGKEVEFLDAQNTISVTHARETHPFLVIDRRGNVHLIPKNKYQTALARAQRTFLKHIVPGRYRVQL